MSAAQTLNRTVKYRLEAVHALGQRYFMGNFSRYVEAAQIGLQLNASKGWHMDIRRISK